MNANAKKLVAALRSGEYKQGVGQLKNGGEFCCLGVCTDLYKKETGGKWDTEIYSGCAALSAEVKEWVGFSCNLGNYTKNGKCEELAWDNDAGKTFSEIADIIESSPEGLFVEEK